MSILALPTLWSRCTSLRVIDWSNQGDQLIKITCVERSCSASVRKEWRRDLWWGAGREWPPSQSPAPWEDDDDDDGNDDDDDDDDDGDAGDHQHHGEGLENDDGGGAGHQRSQHMCLLSPGKGLEQGANSRSLLGHRSRGSQLPGPPVLHLMICYDHSLI